MKTHNRGPLIHLRPLPSAESSGRTGYGRATRDGNDGDRRAYHPGGEANARLSSRSTGRGGRSRDAAQGGSASVQDIIRDAGGIPKNARERRRLRAIVRGMQR